MNRKKEKDYKRLMYELMEEFEVVSLAGIQKLNEANHKKFFKLGFSSLNYEKLWNKLKEKLEEDSE